MSINLGNYTIVEIKDVTMITPTESEQNQINELEKEHGKRKTEQTR